MNRYELTKPAAHPPGLQTRISEPWGRMLSHSLGYFSASTHFNMHNYTNQTELLDTIKTGNRLNVDCTLRKKGTKAVTVAPPQ